MDPEIGKFYGNRVRTRVCGICKDTEGAILMVNHKMLANGPFWAPPGGGIEFGTDARETLVREFREETGLQVKTGKFLFACEFIKAPLHAVELFFEVIAEGGRLTKGFDPEMEFGKQIIEEVRFLSLDEIMRLAPGEKHGIFNLVKSSDDFSRISGYIKLEV